jgi:hypothetical protein
MATWHQSKSRVKLYDPVMWNVLVDPPGRGRYINQFSTEEKAQAFLESMKRVNAADAKHAIIIPPSGIRLESNPRRKRGRLTPGEAANILTGLTHPEGSRADFHSLRSDDVQYLLDAAKEIGYRAPKGASGSKARYFYAFLKTRQSMRVREPAWMHGGPSKQILRRNPRHVDISVSEYGPEGFTLYANGNAYKATYEATYGYEGFGARKRKVRYPSGAIRVHLGHGNSFKVFGLEEAKQRLRNYLERGTVTIGKKKARKATPRNVSGQYTARDVANYLRSIKGGDAPKKVVPVVLTIGRQTWQGARYVQSDQLRLYMIGVLPAAKVRRRKTVFRFKGNPFDWYVIAYKSLPIEPQYAEYHPFGANFIIGKWSVPDGSAIDKYDTHPYTRVKAELRRA